MKYDNLIKFASRVVDSPNRNVPSEERKAELIREIYASNALAASWFFPEKFLPGSEFGFKTGDCTVKAVADFDAREMQIRMVSPISCCSSKITLYWHPTFFSRRSSGKPLMTQGEPTPFATEKAQQILTGLYTDFILIEEYKKAIPEELVKMVLDLQKKHSEWKEKNVSKIGRYKSLCQQSGQLKKRLRDKEISQEEYISLKEPIRDEIISLQKQLAFRYMAPEFFWPITRETKEISDIWTTLADNYC